MQPSYLVSIKHVKLSSDSVYSFIDQLKECRKQKMAKKNRWCTVARSFTWKAINITYCPLQTSSVIAARVTSSVVSARSTSTPLTFYSIFTASRPPLPPVGAFPLPVIRWPTWTACEYITATSGGRWRCDDRTSAVTTWRWVLSASLGLEHSCSFRITPSPTPSISGCRSPPLNRMEFSYLRASRTVRRFLCAELYRSATVSAVVILNVLNLNSPCFYLCQMTWTYDREVRVRFRAGHRFCWPLASY